MADSFVLDSSVVLAIISKERGAEFAKQFTSQAIVSTVNYAEVVTKLIDWGYQVEAITEMLGAMDLTISDFDEPQALQAGFLRTVTRTKGLSLGDRACLALARATGRIALTAHRAWADLDVGVTIELIR